MDNHLTEKELQWRRELYDRYLELCQSYSEYESKHRLLEETHHENMWGTGYRSIAMLLRYEKARRELKQL